MFPGSILQAKQKCLDIVHSLEVRDIKSFINWMKTFEVKHGPSGKNCKYGPEIIK